MIVEPAKFLTQVVERCGLIVEGGRQANELQVESEEVDGSLPQPRHHTGTVDRASSSVETR
jgi:hypothetical protein